MTGSDSPWIELKEVCGQYGYVYSSAKHAVLTGKFPVKTYKVGKKIVIDKEVHKQYFESRRETGISALGKTTNR